MHQKRKLWWVGLILLPVLAYAGIIIAAYIRPPLRVETLSTGYQRTPVAEVEVQHHGPFPAKLGRATVQGVLPPDEVGAPVPSQGPSAAGERYRIKLAWYQDVDLRWLHCPAVGYRYLGWPLTARGFCDEQLRGAGIRGGPLPESLGEWASWRPPGDGLEYRVRRAGDELFILIAPGEQTQSGGLTLTWQQEEPGDGRARIRLRVMVLPDQMPQSMTLSLPLRRGELDPEVSVEAVRWAPDWKRETPGAPVPGHVDPPALVSLPELTLEQIETARVGIAPNWEGAAALDLARHRDALQALVQAYSNIHRAEPTSRVAAAPFTVELTLKTGRRLTLAPIDSGTVLGNNGRELYWAHSEELVNALEALGR